MDTHHLKVFVAVYRDLSFSQAAERLRVSQPTISEHVKNLEAELDCRLFDRLGRTIRPTREAEMLFPKAARLLEGLESIREELSAAGTEVGGKLVIGASTIPGAYLMPAVCAAFRGRHPRVSYEIMIADSERVTAMVADHSLLIGIVGSQVDDDRLECTPVFEDEIILIAPASMSVGKRARKGELQGLPFLSREEGSGTRRTVESSLRASGVDPSGLNVAATLGSTEAVKQSVKAGMGVSFISRRAVMDELSSGALREIPVRGLRITRDFILVRHRKITLPHTYRAFGDYLLAQGRATRRTG